MRCVVLVVLAGCSSPYDLTCAVLASPSNCFAQEVTRLAACVPMSATPAKLSADQTTCTYADGVSVVFDAPVPSFASVAYNATGLSFTVYGTGAAECGRLDLMEPGGNVHVGGVLDVSDATADARWYTPSDYGGYELACPSHSYTADPETPSTVRASRSSPNR